MEEPERYTLTLRPLPGWGVPGLVRLRRALKTLLRGHGLRCVNVTEEGRREVKAVAYRDYPLVGGGSPDASKDPDTTGV